MKKTNYIWYYEEFFETQKKALRNIVSGYCIVQYPEEMLRNFHLTPVTLVYR